MKNQVELYHIALSVAEDRKQELDGNKPPRISNN
jgi:hypothetical protein